MIHFDNNETRFDIYVTEIWAETSKAKKLLMINRTEHLDNNNKKNTMK